MNKTILDLSNSISEELSKISANKMDETCRTYNLGDPSGYTSSASKQKFLYGLLKEKDDDFIQRLAKQLVDENDTDKVAYQLNEYLSGKYFKISIVTRKNLVVELLKFPKLNGLKTTMEFMRECGLDYLVKQDYTSYFNNIFGNDSKKNERNFNDIISEINLHEVTDQKFFKFLELCVHPYVRTNEQSGAIIITINRFLEKDGYTLKVADTLSDADVYVICKMTGIKDKIKNLIFASNGYKPAIVLVDSLSNEIKIVKNAEYTLVYDRPIKSSGLLFVELVDWWANVKGTERSLETAKDLKQRLALSLGSEPETFLFETYYTIFSGIYKSNLPALIPQIYLHYDPYSFKKYGLKYLLRQRMDFLMLLKNNSRIVIEVDGKQHYSKENIASPSIYAKMVSQDRELKLSGYEVYRFGGYELKEGSTEMVRDFFTKLFKRHNVLPDNL